MNRVRPSGRGIGAHQMGFSTLLILCAFASPLAEPSHAQSVDPWIGVAPFSWTVCVWESSSFEIVLLEVDG